MPTKRSCIRLALIAKVREILSVTHGSGEDCSPLGMFPERDAPMRVLSQWKATIVEPQLFHSIDNRETESSGMILH
jgi:hypothetical protein